MPEPTPAARDTWPSEVWNAAVLRGLEPRARAEIEAAGRLVRVARNASLYEAGEGGDAFFVVASGALELRALCRGDDEETELRVVRAGDSLGEEATIGAARRASAVAVERTLCAEIPVHVFRRAVARSGKAEIADKLERTLLRAAMRDLLATVAFARELTGSDRDILLDAIRTRRVERGEAIYRQGDPPTDFFLLAEGMVQIQTEDLERIHVRAYVTRGDFFGDAEIAAGEPRRAGAVASGPCLLFAVPGKTLRTLADRNPELLPRLRRVSLEQHAAQQIVVEKAANVTQHVFRDLYRLEVARSLLVIDLDTCVRCGHCAWACAELYGVARLVRRGDKLVTRVALETDVAVPQTLMLPNSCQHCENPACMPDCPTGAIGRDPEGEVFIRDELCTGCGACAKACPWDNIQMAPRALTSPSGGGGHAELAVKCDLCRAYEGPACVAACPTSSIFRVNPAEELTEVRDLLGGARPAEARALRRDARPAILGAAVAGAAIAMVGATMQSRGLWSPTHGIGFGAGILAALGFVALLLYVVPKRGVRLWMRRKSSSPRPGAELETALEKPTSRVRPHAILHFAMGLVTLGLAFAHAPWPPGRVGTAGGALFAAFLGSAFAGIYLGLAYSLIPPRLSRLERTASLPEDLAGDRRALVDRLYREVSGRSEVVKKILEKILLPYAHSLAGPLSLVASGRRLREEEARLRVRIDAVLEGRGQERLAGLPELVRIVVELRAIPAQRWLQRALRVGLPVHVVSFAVALVLLGVHVISALRAW